MAREAQFRPPPPERLKTHLAEHEPRGGDPWGLVPWIVGLGVLVILWRFGSPAAWLWVAPLALLAVVLLPAVIRGAQQRTRQARLKAFSEWALREHDAAALRLGWHLIRRLERVPAFQQQVIATMGVLLQRIGAAESAAVVWDWLIARAPEDAPQTAGWHLRRAMARLACDELADADQDVRRGRRNIGQSAELDALLCWAELWQHVATNHDAEALRVGARALDRLRPLGVEAACGYGLLALAAHRAGEAVPGGDAEGAAEWWRRATLLMPPAAMARRCRPLADLPRGFARGVSWPEEMGAAQ